MPDKVKLEAQSTSYVKLYKVINTIHILYRLILKLCIL